MTKELRKKIPPLYAQQNIKDPIVYAKYFMPGSHWTWYVLEFDGKDTFFGYVDGDYQELGYFSLSELEGIRGPLGLKVERDLYWKPKPLSEVKKEISEYSSNVGIPKSLLSEMFPNVRFKNLSF